MRTFLIILAAVLTLGIGGAVENAHASARPVALWDAHYAPTHVAYVYPGASVSFARADGTTCGHGARRGYYSDVSAYRWDGSALGPQRWNASALLYYWHARGDVGAVTYDGRTFHNDTFAPVLVAGWCEN